MKISNFFLTSILLLTFTTTAVMAGHERIEQPYMQAPSFSLPIMNNVYSNIKACHIIGNEQPICAAIAENTVGAAIAFIRKYPHFSNATEILEIWATITHAPSIKSIHLDNRAQKLILKTVQHCKKGFPCIVDGQTFLLLTKTQELLHKMSNQLGVEVSAVDPSTLPRGKRYRHNILVIRSNRAAALAHNIGVYLLGDRTRTTQQIKGPNVNQPYMHYPGINHNQP